MPPEGETAPVAHVDPATVAYLSHLASYPSVQQPTYGEGFPMPIPSAPPVELPTPSAPPADDVPPGFGRRFVEQSNWSSYRVKRAALYTLGGASVTAGIGSLVAVAASVLPPIGIVSGIGFAILGSGLVGWGASIIDYYNPEEVLGLRAKVQGERLERIVSDHSWNHIFEFSILLPDQVYSKFCQSARNLSMPRIINMYEDAQRAYTSVSDRGANEYPYTLPHPTSWRWKFEEELSRSNASQFFQSYDLVKLKKYGFISNGAFRELRELRTVYTSDAAAHYRQVSLITAQYRDQIRRIQNEKRQNIKHAQDEYDNHPSIVRLKNIDTEYEQRIASALRGVNERIETAFDRYDAFRDGLLDGRTEEMLDNRELERLDGRLREYDAVRSEAEREADRICGELQAEKGRTRTGLEREQGMLETQRRGKIERITAQSERQLFDLRTAEAREIEIVSAPFRARIDAMNVRFSTILRTYNLLA